MRSVAFAVCLFLNVMLFGICGYMYLLWLQYWRHLWHEKQQQMEYDMNDFRRNEAVVEYDDSLTQVTTLPKPATPKDEKKSPLSFLHRDTYVGGINAARLVMMKTKIIGRLRQALFDESNNVNLDLENPYAIQPRDFKIVHDNLVCDLREKLGAVRMLKKSDVDRLSRVAIPDLELFSNDTYFNTCAIVTNAGSLYQSKMGRFIDSNDLVLRFNNAPTEGYERDVGSKTTIRILNSQILSKSEFHFLTSRMYKNTSLLVWDPSNYSATLQQWWNNPEHNFIEPYVEFRKKNPASNFHILDPSTLWLLWDYIQGHTSTKIRPNPPSSGFLGIALLLPYCSTVNVVEYVPTQRSVQRCHYYETNANPLCTYGVWHPLAAEKLISYAMNVASDRTVFYDGYISIPGYSKISCK